MQRDLTRRVRSGRRTANLGLALIATKKACRAIAGTGTQMGRFCGAPGGRADCQVTAHNGGSRCVGGMRHCSLNVTVMVCMSCRVLGPRPGRERPPLTCPSGAAVSGPDLPAPYLREEDPPCCRRWRRARDALRARVLRRRHGSGAGQAGGRCIMSRAGALYIIAAINEAAAGRGPGGPARRGAAHQAPAAGRPGGSMLVRARGMLAAVRRSTGGARGGGRRGRPGLGAAAQPD